LQFDTKTRPSFATTLVGIAFRAERKTADKIVDRLRFHP
jgi:hypothetical protein